MSNKGHFWQYIKRYKFNSLFVRNYLLGLIPIMLLILFMGVFFQSNTKTVAENEILNVNLKSLSQFRATSDEIFKSTGILAANHSLQENVQLFMISSNYDKLMNNSVFKIIDLNRLYTSIYHYIDSIYVYSEKNRSVIESDLQIPIEKFDDDGWYNAYQESKGKDIIILPHKKGGRYPFILSFIKPIYDNSTGKAGAVIVNIDMGKYGEFIQETDSQSNPNIYILSKDGRVVYCQDEDKMGKDFEATKDLEGILTGNKEFVGKMYVNQKQSIVSFLPSKYYDLNFVSVFPLDFYNDKFQTTQNAAMIILIVLVIFGLTVLFFITKRFYNSIENILSAVEEPEKYQVEYTNSEADNSNELRRIMTKIAVDFRNKKQVEQELEDKLKLLHQAQVGALQAQINPHFLYNTLETINWLAIDMSDTNNPVSESLTSLSNFFRMSLDMDNYLIPIRNEIEQAKLYIKILQLRYSKKFSITWDIDEAIMKYLIVKISLQPILENAVYHGIRQKGGCGSVIVKGWEANGVVYIDIKDDGVGIPQEKLKKINKDLSEGKYVHGESDIGLFNVNKRIELMFGAGYGLKIFSDVNEGTSVIIRIPAQENIAEEGNGDV